MNLLNTQLIIPFKTKKVIKVISGLSNLDINNIIRIAKSAEIAKVSYIDIVANTKIVSFLKNLTSIPICVSSINPIELYSCVLAGADLVEIGNFDFFYKKKIQLSMNQILQLARETRSLIIDKDICVTIPYIFNLYQQQYLAKELEILGINIIQTEAPQYYNYNFYKNKKFDNYNDPLLKSIKKAAASLCSTYLLSRNVNIPIITASNLDSLSSLIAINCGAAGVGIGSNIQKQNTIYDMSNYLDEIYYSFNNSKDFMNKNSMYISVEKEILQILSINKIN